MDISNLDYAEQLWLSYKSDSASVPIQWREYFDTLSDAPTSIAPAAAKPNSAGISTGRGQLLQEYGPGGKACAGCGRAEAMSLLQFNVSHLIRNYRVRGHLMSDVNPLGYEPQSPPELQLDFYGLTKDDLDLKFNAGSLAPGPITLREIITILEATYCGAIGVQFMHIDGLAEREWLQLRMESIRNRLALSGDRLLRIAQRLSDAVLFEEFLQKKFVGAKSFSLEGAETLIPLMDMAIEKAGDQGITRICIGMPHRGRLNVLANIMGKPPAKILGEFKDADPIPLIGRGDVKYHLGYHRDWTTSSGKSVALDLMFNPSHLEFVSPVALGSLRAAQVSTGDHTGDTGMAILMHGDAAIIGEGIVQETLNLSEVDGYSTGGSLHIVVNNQIGFTTLSSESRSSKYASDIAKMLQVPIFHVNGENPEAVAQALDVALDYRAKFKRDVFIDMYCYRRRGHNEGDEPMFTQPLMYKAIKRRPTVFESYSQHLINLGELDRAAVEEIRAGRLAVLEDAFDQVRMASSSEPKIPSPPSACVADQVSTGVGEEILKQLLDQITDVPDGFTPHDKIVKLLDSRRATAHEGAHLDWGAAEALAFATLASDGVHIRLSGQDSQRGTFSHRHAVLHDVNTGATHMPLAFLHPAAGRVDILNSPLSEGALLGFEYGYSIARPDTLTIWEAQFGDFANAAQVYIDQFIASGETKWNVLSGLVMLLPHGLEGTGPEHASARLERFLSLAATANYQVVSPTTPTQYFHLLRRQALRKFKKPLVVMSPKSMLRNKVSFSAFESLTSGVFQEIIPDSQVPASRAQGVLLCNGKVYYDLIAARDSQKIDDVAIIRIEQLYPLERGTLSSILGGLPSDKPVVWVQEEPLNMGAFPYLQLHHFGDLRSRWQVSHVGRAESASPATGSAASHKLEQQQVVDKAFALVCDR